VALDPIWKFLNEGFLTYENIPNNISFVVRYFVRFGNVLTGFPVVTRKLKFVRFIAPIRAKMEIELEIKKLAHETATRR
jgi:hypothetical protein